MGNVFYTTRYKPRKIDFETFDVWNNIPLESLKIYDDRKQKRKNELQLFFKALSWLQGT